MKITDLGTGAKLELELYDVNEMMMDHLLISEFEWAEDEKTAFLAAPIYEGRYFLIRPGTKMNVYFNRKAEFYCFSASLLDRTVKDNLPLLKIAVTGAIERIQRRQFFRFDCMIPVKYRIVDPESDLKKEKTPFTDTVTRDLSGGGACIALKEKVDLKRVIQCELHLSKTDVIKFLGKVVRLSDYEEKGLYKYEIGVEFIDMDNRNREAIISFIFQEQRKLMKKGLV